LQIGPNFVFQQFKNKIILNFVKCVATKKGLATIFFHPSLLLLFLDLGSGMGKNQDPGSGIAIPDPPHLGFSLFRFAKRQTEMEGLTQDGVTSTRALTTNLLQSK
jgi:hypothetical protein